MINDKYLFIKSNTLIIVYVFAILNFSITDIFANIYGPWLTFQSIQGVGGIVRTYPPIDKPFRNRLHYSGNNNPETADFEINVEDAYDCDGRVIYDNYYNPIGIILEDMGINEDQTDWGCTTGTGTVVDGGISTTFTPSNGIYSGIQIGVRIHDGDEGNSSEYYETIWIGYLTTFKVGVHLEPGDTTFWEDDIDPSKTIMLHSSVSGLVCDTGWTGTLADPGQVSDSGDLDPKNVTWATIAATDGIDISSVMGKIYFKPYIECSGEFRCMGFRAGVDTGGLIGKLLTAIVGFVNPYVGAAATFLIPTGGDVGTKTQYKNGFIAKTVIENIATLDINEVFVDNKCPGGDSKDVNLGLVQIISPDYISRAPNASALNGSFDAATYVEAIDFSWVSMAISDTVCLEEGEVKYGTYRPYYEFADWYSE